jgi:precorrin-6A/cobalt-precorrin-6A reductase
VPLRLLILGGTSEAALLAAAARDRFADSVRIETSLAGRLPAHHRLPGEVRRGGFGGAGGLAAYLRQRAVDAVIDATHPFAATISGHAAEACADTGVARLLLVRPPWTPEAGDRWCEVSSAADAAAVLPLVARRAFLTTGPGSLAAFADVSEVWFLVRLFEPPPSPLALGPHGVVVARPPFTVADEVALMDVHGIEAVVSKQSGGPTAAKLAAARRLGLPVVMIARPEKPAGERVDSVAAALAWLAARLDAEEAPRSGPPPEAGA